MFEYKKISQNDLEEVIKIASLRIGVNEVILEKDYWVCFVLNYLFSKCKWKDAFTFKGGTSLSKCFGLIQRFSEDIDLILDWRVIGYRFDEPWLERTNTKQGKFNKESNQKTEEFLKNEFVSQLDSDFKDMLNEEFHISIDESEPSTVLFEYPKVFKSSYVTQAVRLEIGTLASWTPSKVVHVVPDIQKIYPMLFDGDFIEVRSVLPERTFWEKATILHHEANRPKELAIPKRYARHYYDLVCIANSPYKDRALKNSELLEDVVQFKQKFYPRKWAKYEEATTETIRLVPEDYRLKEIKEDYKNMTEMFFGEYPSFENLINSVLELEKEIHKIQ
ncbi:MAG: nucleotidyl transferase AbiEii/AbiGii toxin family protein [Mogibacterium sp.]|uniref:nucleotidyl transferase AbiEii/AbiGii toxin family protein n=1 Tax=Mogibacterium sp. TaxID=2049035 RepID=UPI0017C71406|nr:nucleotidyl transferase AbiEii/AbiGii toxin family protein [Mogibacterium sp.]MBB1532882.1 nucleotidyl transferase AbiEii/AbiGii toxin family protein [Mogibacterium sp.]